MRYLVFANTPAHVHLYRNLVGTLRADGEDVLVLGRDYGCTHELLEYYELPFELYGRQGASVGSLLRNLPRQCQSIVRRARAFDPDLVFGRGPYAALAGTVTGTDVVLVLDSEPSEFLHRVSSRFARAILTPAAFDGVLGPRHFRFDGLQECAYLHPDVFTPDPGVRADLGVGADEPYAIVRFNAFDALHDVGTGGEMRPHRRRLVRRLAEHVTVLVSDESGTLPIDDLPARRYDLHPGRMHDALAEADVLVTETGTMATEAGLLGTPAVRFVDEVEASIGEFVELERAGLVVQHTDAQALLETATGLVTDDGAADRWRANRERYLADKPNLTRLLRQVAARPRDLESLGGSTDRLRPAVPH
jgi:predicted glycosyltransferase